MAQQVRSSYWEQDTYFKHYDIIIIGGGLVGLSTALALTKCDEKLNIAVLERGAIPTGASTRNAGFACFGSISELASDLNSMSTDELKALIQMRKTGLDKLRSLVDDSQIDYEELGGFEYFISGEEALHENCITRIEEFNKLVFDATGLAETFEEIQSGDVGIRSKLSLIKNRYEGQLHPAKMVRALVDKVSKVASVFYGAEVASINETNEQLTIKLKDSREMSCDKLIHATNGFTQHLQEIQDVMPVRNQVFVTNPLATVSWKGCYHSSEGYVYFRRIGNRILIGGARHKFEAENIGSFGMSGDVESYLSSFLTEQLGINELVQFEYKWSGILAVGSQKKPIIRQVSPRQYIGIRMGGMGVAIGCLVGEELAKLVVNAR